MKFSDKYDVVVIGGGPAGSIAARTTVEKGLKTLLLEKDRDFGVPVRCGEGISLPGMKNFIEPNPKWVDNYLARVRFIAPDGTVLPINLIETGCVLNRKVFDFELARRAAEAGAEVRNRCCATGLEYNANGITVKFEHGDELFSVKSQVVIGADGVESRVGRWAGLDTSLPLADVETCYQVTLYYKSIEIEYCDFYFGNTIAPGGYIWLFPKGKNCANVGIGIAGDRAKDKSPESYLEDFIEKRFPGSSILSSMAGSVPSRHILKKMVTDRVLIAGDAAHQANPLTGGGILSGMWGGRLAAETAVEAFESGDFSAAFLY
ncbi:MAG: NAD(P)/FAD-dependent oxidoreductase [FCB group bacterium]|nr:NAD(P)/FAD-dependent oxidoreductase [FCB group bacterium]